MTIKRLFDIFFSFILLLLLLPLLIFIAVLVRANLGSPVLFCQTRPGFNEQPFQMFKFRTMRNTTDDNIVLEDSLRLTGFGKLLRSTSLDELPELWNVLKNDMSLVGPRPLLMEYLTLYNDKQRRRHEVKPGITGWAQINGRNAITWEEKLKLDVWYVDNQTLLLDIKILFLTIKKVFIREGVSANGHATTERFKGNG